ncbi:hypothetical protein S7711_01930 [Stachybotrys chartarum IBT 7711]|uniref:DNA mismatch repair protein HSM3 N-terminal domain-containing protein n=1 Tax=Stachybotrys chartarum (strain CBS 109288 / IBT 7711) TaxID=1280523 RepID=A0A084AMV6_STACB|nr:hypothetical protein S7711_01930 [Stachybotrys chartarum IBT 7711]
MENVEIFRLPELQAHLQALVDDPALPPDAQLLDDISLQLTDANIPPLLPQLLPLITNILLTTTHDPGPLFTFTIKLLSPLSFTDCLAFADQTALLTALQSPAPGANLLAVTIVHKAARTPADVAVLAGMQGVVEEVLKRWLDSPHVGVGSRCQEALGDLLKTESGVPSTGAVNGTREYSSLEQSRLWDLVFSLSSLSIITKLCSPNPHDSSRQAYQQYTTAQDRLIRILPHLATLNLPAITQTSHPELFPLPPTIVASIGQGLLQWALMGMVDKSDLLMHMCLVDGFESLVKAMSLSPHGLGNEAVVKNLVRIAAQGDPQLGPALRDSPNRVEDQVEADNLRAYIAQLLN